MYVKWKSYSNKQISLSVSEMEELLYKPISVYVCEMEELF